MSVFTRTHISRRRLLAGAAGIALIPTHHRRAAAEVVENQPEPVADPQSYRAYVPAASKQNQWFQYTCEFDAAWAVMKTFGVDAGLDEQIDAIGLDNRSEPYYRESAEGVVIYGGDIGKAFCGDYKTNFLARSTGRAMRKVFKEFGMEVGRVKSRRGIEKALDAGKLVWIKTTVDFLDWVPATWVTPEGREYQVVLGNDHAAVVMGYNEDVVVIRDVLGPTSSNWQRVYEYEVAWDRFLRCWASQGSDGLAVGPPAEE